MLAPDWTWWSAVPAVLAVIALLLIPGGLLLRVLGVRDPRAWGAAPLLSTSIVTVGGIVASWLSIAWGLPALLGSVALACLVAEGLRRLIHSEPRGAEDRGLLDVPAAMLGLSTGLAVAATIFLAASGSPGAIPQQPDPILHLGITETFVEDRDISALTGLRFMAEDDAGFYHAAIHGIAATVALVTGAPSAVAMSSTVLVVVALVFPAGMLLLVPSSPGWQRRSPLACGGWGTHSTSGRQRTHPWLPA